MDALYRMSSGEVTVISDNDMAERTGNYIAILSSPNFTDGIECRDSNGNLRVLGYAKIVDGSDVRNATQVEIDTFAAAELDDKNDLETINAIKYFETHPQFRRVMIAFADILVSEFNTLREQHSLPNRTLAQLKTAIKNRISKDD